MQIKHGYNRMSKRTKVQQRINKSRMTLEEPLQELFNKIKREKRLISKQSLYTTISRTKIHYELLKDIGSFKHKRLLVVKTTLGLFYPSVSQVLSLSHTHTPPPTHTHTPELSASLPIMLMAKTLSLIFVTSSSSSVTQEVCQLYAPFYHFLHIARCSTVCQISTFSSSLFELVDSHSDAFSTS